MNREHLARVIILSLILSLGALIYSPLTQADRLESDSFIIQFGNFNVTSGEKSSGNYNVTDTVGQTAAGPFGDYGSTNYFLGAGFQYIYQIDEFSFSISDLSIDFGSLVANSFSTQTNQLTINTRGAGGYTVYAYEQQPMTISGGSTTIPDTTCDNDLCDETSAEVWSVPTNHGFGFNMTGDNVSSDFVDTTYFRQFADNSTAEAMQPIMSSTAIASLEQSTVTYKISISGSQAAGDYQTTVMFVAVPGY